MLYRFLHHCDHSRRDRLLPTSFPRYQPAAYRARDDEVLPLAAHWNTLRGHDGEALNGGPTESMENAEQEGVSVGLDGLDREMV